MRLLVVTLVVWCVLGTGSAHSKLVAISVQPEVVGQGKTAVVRAVFDSPPDSVQGAFLSKPIHFFPLDSLTYRGLIGVPIGAVTGANALTVRVVDSRDSAPSPHPEGAVDRLVVTIVKTDFEVDTLRLPKPKMDTLASAMLEKETNVIGPKFNALSTQKMWKDEFLMPVQGRITTTFGSFRVYNDGNLSWPHKGIDIAVPEGTPILACAPGTVLLAQKMAIHGRIVMLDHGQGVVSVYCHLRKIGVKPGDKVEKGGYIGTVGHSGVSTGPHLHWGLSVANVRVNPIEWTERKIE
jgi:hypothetical protein